ncbi:extracellular solute-binding protein [Paenibacillus aurantius]|uniref:Extracellular solute-binding protein n=1 Tax=Paenibacillus aurantius TaxID=2918900 RepID=A0AA96RDI7_9BACL|nr:extracellular solute-binding protein [Paenibacillus aurantius]WNQ09461.1 extracellular solute-binding protein [Paenibacillus aurantius]
MKKSLTVLTAAFVASSLLTSACSKEAPAAEGQGAKPVDPVLNETGYPIVKEPVKLQFFTGRNSGGAENFNERMLWKEYAKKTGIDVDFQLVNFENLSEKFNLAMSSGNYPDAFHTARISTNDIVKYGSQGMFIPLNGMIDKYAPNFKKLLDQYPAIKKGITMPDGNIYSVPLVYEPDFYAVLISQKLWINNDWLTKLKMPVPKTLDDYYSYLKAVKNTDLNGNGKADEIPYGGVGTGSLLEVLKGSFGLMNKGTNHRNVDVDPATNKLRFIPTDPRYKELLQYLNKLYTEGLIDKDITTIKNPAFAAKGSQGIYGSLVTTFPSTVMGQKQYVIPAPFEGPHGDKLFTNIQNPLVQPGAFVITDKNKHPEATMRWIDYFFSDEGQQNFFMGFEGVTFKKTADGKLNYTDEIMNNPKGMEQGVMKYLTWPGGSYPGYVTKKYFKAVDEETNNQHKVLGDSLPKENWPAFTYTVEESDQMKTLWTDLNTYIDGMTVKFITGAAPFSEWDNYTATVKKMKVDEYMKLYEGAAQRYQSSK